MMTQSLIKAKILIPKLEINPLCKVTTISRIRIKETKTKLLKKDYLL